MKYIKCINNLDLSTLQGKYEGITIGKVYKVINIDNIYRNGVYAYIRNDYDEEDYFYFVEDSETDVDGIFIIYDDKKKVELIMGELENE